jgi:beta-N-acetylhexosaminidase
MKKLYILCFLLYTLYIPLYTMENTGIVIPHTLTLDQKIGQLFMVSAVSDETIAQTCMQEKSYQMDKKYIKKLITNYQIGGILFLGTSSKEHQIQRTCYFQQQSIVPLLIGQDLEPGRVGASRFPGFFHFPHNTAIGKTNKDEHTFEIAHTIGNICKELGVHINFAPVADINNNPHNPIINTRSFGKKPDKVAHHAHMFAQGLQKAGIIACAKHFPGHGDTAVDSHNAIPTINHHKKHLKLTELVPFIQLINNGIPMIMIGHLFVPAFESEHNLPATLSYAIITTLLRKKLGFKGVIITDALDMGAITQNYSDGEAELQALLAGNDILLCSPNVPAAFAKIKEAVEKGIISEAKLDEHVARIVHLKKMCGLL